MRLPGTIALLTFTISANSLPAQQEPPEIFRALDANNDGRVSMTEVPEAQRPYFQRVLRIGDRNDDGVITREEFVAAFRPESPPDPARRFDGARPGQTQRDRFGGGFTINAGLVDRFDQNQDGKLTLDEVPRPLQQMLRPAFERAGKEELTREDLNRLAARQLTGFLERLDANDDGKVALSELPESMRENWKPIFDRANTDEITLDRLRELLAERSRQPRPDGARGPNADRTPNPEAMLRQRDANGDGYLSRDEAQLDAGFDRIDRDGDGRLSAEELRQATLRRRTPQ